MISLIQPSMSAGELTPSLYSRVDMELYRLGLAKAKNFTVSYHGGIERRPGTRFIGEAASNDSVVLIPFEFSTIQTYVIEFTDRKIRIIKDGGFITKGNSILEVVTPYLNDELSRISYTQSADVLSLFHRNHMIMQLKRFADDDWRLEGFENQKGPFDTINIEDTKTIYVSNQDGAVNITSTFDVFDQELVGQSLFLEQQTSGANATWVQRMAVGPGAKCYYAGNYYQATYATNNGTPAQTGDNPPVHLEGEEWDGPNQVLPDDNRKAVIGVKWRYLHSGFGIVRIDSVTGPRNATGTVISTIPDTIVGGDVAAKTWSFPDELIRRDYPISPTSSIIDDFTVTLEESGKDPVTINYGSEWVINFQSNIVTLLIDPGRDPQGGDPLEPRDVVIRQKSSTKSTYKWAFEVMSDSKGFPQCGTYYQQRFSFAGTKVLPQTLWMSRTDSFPDFSVSRPLLADDSMRFDVNSLQVNEITHMLPLNALLLFTSGGVWSINQGSNDVITPETPPNVRIQSYDGAAPIRPIVTGSNGLYVQTGGQVIRDIGFDFSSDSYIGVDLTVRSTHLFRDKTIVSWCYAKNPNKLIWVVFDDGTFACLTYMKEQQVWGWTSQETDGRVKWCAAIQEGVNDAVYFAVERDGVNFIERLSDIKYTREVDQFFVDSGLTYDGSSMGKTIKVTASDYGADNECTLTTEEDYFDTSMVGKFIKMGTSDSLALIEIDSVTDARTATGFIQIGVPDSLQDVFVTSWGLAVSKVTGLDHLEGKTVSTLCDGATGDQQVVNGGSITLDNPCVVIHAGLPMEALVKTLDLELSAPPESSRAKKKLINKVSVHVNRSSSFEAGSRLDALEYPRNRNEENYGFPPEDRNDVMEVNCDARWNDRGSIYIRQKEPTALNILAIIPDVSVSEM